MVAARAVQDIGFQSDTVVTVGTFDGVHAGHRAIIREVTGRARTKNCRSVVVTFDPHPRTVVGRGPARLLSTLEERLHLIEELEVDATLVLEFTYAFSRQSPREFYEKYLIRGTGMKEVIIGHDHMFGRDRVAGTQELQQLGGEFGFATTVVAPVKIDGDTVSSSRIRELLLEGNVDRAERLLQRPYDLTGIVVHGDGRGAQIGFPTANIAVDNQEKLIPANGVYLVSVDCNNNRLYGMLNIGVRPTFGAGSESTIEVHVLEFNGDLYEKKIGVQFLKRLRPEKKFESVGALIHQLENDRNETKKYISALQSL